MSMYKLDITEEHCPMTFVKAKLELAKLKSGEMLEVLLKEGEPLDNVPKSSEEQGFEIVEISHVENDIFKVLIKK
ncbi:MAG: sulfurtransferase TusA family protein [Thermodesulfovibrionia bacterium]|nr:sulfurtransferase TusA family protein [Thermodesulfovibrionia bacterium]